MSAAVRGVVFDLDGTLIDSMPLVLRAYAYALAPHGPPLSEAELSARMGGPPQRIFARLLSEPAAIADALQRLEGFGRRNWGLIQAYDGVRPMLERLRADGVATAIWTGRERASTEWLLHAHGIAPLIRACVCGDDFPSHKPDPEGLVAALRAIGVDADAARFVGDDEVDVLAGAALGVRTVLISHGQAVPTGIARQAWRVANTPAEAYALVVEGGDAESRK